MDTWGFVRTRRSKSGRANFGQRVTGFRQCADSAKRSSPAHDGALSSWCLTCFISALLP